MSKFIQKLTLVNFKAMTRTCAFKPVTIIHGDNETGKTGIGSDAVRIGLLGYSPRHGNKPGLTFGFAGAKQGAATMSITLDMSDGNGVVQNWDKRNGSVAYSKMGTLDIPAVPPVLLDTREYLKKSGPEKIRYVFGLVDLPALGFTTEKMTARLKADVKVEQPTEDSEKALNELVDEIVLLAEQRDEGNQTYQQWMENVVAHVKAQKEAAVAVLDDMEGTIQGLTQLRTQDAKQAPDSVRKELEALRETYQESILARQTLENKQAEYDKAVAALAKAKRDFAASDNRADELAKLQKEKTELTAKLANFKSETTALLQKKNPIDVKIAELSGEAAGANAQADDLEIETESALKQSCCPTCKSKGSAWKKSLKADAAKRVKQLRTKALDAMAEAVKLKDNSRKLTAQIEAARKADIAHHNDRTNADRLANAINDLQAHQKTLADIAWKLSAATKAVPPMPEAGAVEKATGKSEQIREKITAMEDQDRLATAAIQDEKRTAQAQRNFEMKKAEVEVLKLAQKVILALQQEMTSLAFGTFMGKVNRFCSGILRDGVTLEYRDGEIGYFRDASWVGLDYFSGIEELTTFAGLSVALCQQSPIKLVIMDELGRMKGHRKAALVKRMIELVAAGTIDQFIGIDVDHSLYQLFHNEATFGMIEV